MALGYCIKTVRLLDTGSFSPEGVAPRSKKTITIPALASLMSDKGEYFIIFEFLHKKKQLWAEEGYIQMEEQLPLKNDPAKQPIASVAKGKNSPLARRLRRYACTTMPSTFVLTPPQATSPN